MFNFYEIFLAKNPPHTNNNIHMFCITFLDDDKVIGNLKIGNKYKGAIVNELCRDDDISKIKYQWFCPELNKYYSSIKEAKHDLLAFKLSGIK